MIRYFFFSFIVLSLTFLKAQHNSNNNCLSCHSNFKIGGTAFTDSTGVQVDPGIPILFLAPDGTSFEIDKTDANGNFYDQLIPDNNYLIKMGDIQSKTWHNIPEQGGCNSCHIVDGNGSAEKTKRMPRTHTSVPDDNDCTHCHHFPASMEYSQVMTPSVLSTTQNLIDLPEVAQASLLGTLYDFNPADYDSSTVRPDIFAPGYYSMFDVILKVAKQNGIDIQYEFDTERSTHFITSVNGQAGSYWYRFSFDTNGKNNNEYNYERKMRWDEVLWRPGAWVWLTKGENLTSIKSEYRNEIERENNFGHLVPSVEIKINASDFEGNPEGSGRITTTKKYENISVTSHNLRSEGNENPYSKPFQPGVTTALDIVMSMKDQGLLNAATSVFYNYFGGTYIESYYLVELGFPDVGSAHASGRQGFIYRAENGSPSQSFHITSDILVIHAPDFATWTWVELGSNNPYYESENPITSVNESINEDHNAMPKGFNLHAPYPNPFNSNATVSYNIFEPGDVKIVIFDELGQSVKVLLDEYISNIGVHTVNWEAYGLSSGVYYVLMKYNNSKQARRIVYLK